MLTMRTRIPIAGMIALAFSLPCVLWGQSQSPWAGNWALNPAESTQRTGPVQYERSTFRVEESELGLKVSYDMVETRGGRTHVEWTGAFDGVDYAVQGVDYVLTNAYRLIDDRSYEITVKIDGALAATTRVEVSADGQTLTTVTSERDGAGNAISSTAVYNRQ